MRKVEGVPIEIDFGRRKDTFYIHPDGALNDDSIEATLKIEGMQRAARKFAKIQKQLNAGSLDEEEYQVEIMKLDKQKAEAIAKIGEPENETTLEDIEAQYKSACESLLNAKDGEPPSFEDYERLEKESAQWYRKTLYKPFAVPFLRSCVLDWTLYADDDAEARGERLPVTIDTLNELSEDQIKLAFVKITTYYAKEKKEEKKSNASSLNGTANQTAEQALSLNGGDSTRLPSDGALAIPISCNTNGESESIAAP